MRRIILAAAVLLSLSQVVRAAGLDPKQVAADAKWVMHLDCDGARASKVGSNIRAEILKHEKAAEGLKKFTEATGMDPEKDLHGVTLYGNKLVPGTGVVLIHGRMDKAKVVEQIKSKPDYKTSTYGAYEIYSFTERHGKPVNGAFHGSEIVISGSADEVKAALDVLDGKAASISGATTSLQLSAPPGTNFQAAAVGVSDAKVEARSPLVRQCDQISIAAGENGGENFLQAKIVAKSADVAKDVKEAAEGMRAIGRLKFGPDEELLKIVNALKADASDKTVTVEWRASTENTLKLLEKARETRHWRTDRKRDK